MQYSPDISIGRRRHEKADEIAPPFGTLKNDCPAQFILIALANRSALEPIVPWEMKKLTASGRAEP
jgi:hypothetical protein